MKKYLKIIIPSILVLFLTGCGEITSLLEGDSTYIVTYNSRNADSGIVPVDHNEYSDGEKVIVKSNSGNLTKNESYFLGWSSDTNGDTLYNPNETFSISDSDVILYAVWFEYPIYTVTFNSVDADTPATITQSITYPETTISSFPEDPIRTGYTFDEWNTNSDGSGYSSNSEESFIIDSSDTVFYAIWSVNQNISATISILTSSDITFSETLTVSKTETLIVTIQEEFLTYSWYLNGELLSGEESQSISIIASELYLGLHNLVAIVVENNGVYSSGNCRISVTE